MLMQRAICHKKQIYQFIHIVGRHIILIYKLFDTLSIQPFGLSVNPNVINYRLLARVHLYAAVMNIGVTSEFRAPLRTFMIMANRPAGINPDCIFETGSV